MRSNVGGMDRVARSVLGPALLLVGWRALSGRRALAAAALVGGAVITETALTATGPVNRVLGLDSRAGRQVAGLRNMAESGMGVSPRLGNYDSSSAWLSERS
jgi:hypothetical protein